ncbi:hypothetical protein P5763_24350 [Bacillus cereus]|uniref:hypothetical protein n=1 Tax=Bacillus cereus TaxID=1396 RepID=UPI002405CBF9|nr:hypothetical protein [Bacillus cereus]MDF9615148.1 hypothetical protein [Bacillus cereus]
MAEKTLVNAVRPLFVTNYHTLYDIKFLVSFLYIDGQSVAQFVAEESEFDNPIDKLRDHLIANFDLSSFEVLTATEEIYVSSLATEDVSVHLVSREETSETFRLWEREDVQQSMIVIHDLVDPASLSKKPIKKLNRVEKILIAILLQVANGLNDLSMKLQMKRGN